MTEPGTMEPFETRFADRVRAYTVVATARRIDALGVSRAAMSSQRTSGWSVGPLGADLLGRRVPGSRWVALVAVVLIGVVATAVLVRPSDLVVGPQPTSATSMTPIPSASAGGQIPDFLRHSRQRPLPITPDQAQWTTGFLRLAGGLADFGPEPGTAASRSAVAAVGIDTLVFTATVETQGCAIGTIGAYRWSVAGQGTVMTLTAVDADACAARQEALAGQWVRSDLPNRPADGGPALSPGTYQTSAFDPFGDPGLSGQLSYRVPQGWNVIEDQPASFVLHHVPDPSPGQVTTNTLIGLLAQPRMAAVFETGASCGPFSEAPGVGRGVDDIVTAIIARPGLVSTPPADVTIGGYEGQMLDLQLEPSWTGGCEAPEGTIVGVPLLVGAGLETGPAVGIGVDHPLRLILLDLADRRTMSITIFNPETSRISPFEDQVAAAMPIIDSFRFRAPAP